MKLETGLHLRTLSASAITAAVLVTATIPAGAANEYEQMFDVAFGVDITSDYIWRGYDLSDGPAIQPWVEYGHGIFYLGYWGSNIVDDWEHDLSIGFRPQLGPFSLDIGYVRYMYNSGDCCGELYALATVNPVEPVTLGASVYYSPETSDTYLEANAAFSLPHDLELSGAVGVQTFGAGGDSDTSWNAGLSWYPTEWLSLDGRFHDGPDVNKFVVSLSVSSALSAIQNQ